MMNSYTRRSFLRSSGLAAAVVALPVGSIAQSATGATGAPAIRLGLASYTFRNFDRAHLIAFMKQLHLTYLNAKDVKDHLPMDPVLQAAALADYAAAGIKVTAVGNITFDKDDDEDIRKKFEYCKAAGVSVMVCAPTKQVLPRMEKFVKQYDIRMAIHNHGPEDKNFPSPFDVLAAVRNMDPRIGCCIDIGHASRAGADVIKAVHAAGPRLFDMHFKDLADYTSRDSQVAVGDGIIPIPGIFRALIEIKYPGYVDLEYEIFPDDPMPGVIKSFAYMRGVLAGMRYKA